MVYAWEGIAKMAKIEITKTELVWPGKYNEDGTRRETPRVSLPFQVIETINESRATREVRRTGGTQGGLFDIYEGTEGQTFDEGWKNKLIWGDNLLVMGSLLDKFAGKIDLIYIDPPFATGADFSFTTTVGDSDEQLFKDQSLIEEKAYRDTWGRGLNSYLSMISQRLVLLRDLLSERGSLYLHTDHRVSSHVKLLCDEIFGTDAFRNVVTWRRQIPRGMKVHAKFMPFSADFLLFYAKSDAAVWNEAKKVALISMQEAREKYMEDDKGFFRTSDPGTYSDESLIRLHKEGRIYVSRGGKLVVKDGNASTTRGSIGVKYYRERRGDKVVEETVIDNIWDDVPGMGVMSSEYLGYPTQKPEALLRRIIEVSSDPAWLVADFFCGSGTTMAVAEKLGRRWIGCDLGRFAIHTTRKRLLGIDVCKPFEILNLGKYERQYWQMATFGEKDKRATEQALFEYLAFVLKLYGAQPVPGLQHLHGKKGRALVHIGAVDAPVTIDEVNLALAECLALKQAELHVLGWEWEMGLNALMVGEAKKQGVKLLLLQIPREVMEQQAVDKGDVRFFELAFLDAEVAQPKKLTAKVTLKDFVISDTDLIPEEVRSKIRKWSDYIDYWAVDWDFQNDTFMQGWVTYRTRKDRTLALHSDAHTYDKAARYRILIKVVDIFGNDTSRAFDVEVK
jgi:DNA modification methylase